MKSTLEHLYSLKRKAFLKMSERHRQNVKSGRFHNLPQKKQHKSLDKLRRLLSQFLLLDNRLKYSALGIPAALLAGFSNSNAQGLGPFVKETDRQLNPLRPELPVGISRAYPTFADFDGDGDIDLYLTANTDTPVGGNERDYIFSAANYIVDNGNHFFSENGTNNPIPFIELSSFSYRHKLEYVDIDGDGDLDAFTPSVTDSCGFSSILFFQNDGNNNFSVYESRYDSENPFYNTQQANFGSIYRGPMTFVDLDNDGDLDVLSQGTLFQNIGDSQNPEFSQIPRNPSGFQLPFDIKYSIFLDLDGDGDKDMIAQEDVPWEIKYYRNDNPPDPAGPSDLDNFVETTDSKLNGIQNRFFREYTVPKLADTDNDGDLDLILFASFSQEYDFYFFENTGNYNFTELPALLNPLAGIEVEEQASPSLVDFDQDGDLDLFLGSRFDGFYYFRQDDQFIRDDTNNELAFFENDYGDNGTKVEFADFDGDGEIDDAYVGSFVNDGFYRFRNIPPIENKYFPSSLSSQVRSANGPTFNSQLAVSIGDIDGDGDLDAMLSGIYSGGNYYPTYFENTGGSTFAAGITLDNPAQMFPQDARPELIDIDHDGDADAFFGLSDGTVQHFESNGDIATMTQQTGANNPLEGPVNGSPSGNQVWPEFGDIDNDGDLDLVLGKADGKVEFFRNENETPSIDLQLDNAISFTEKGSNELLIFDVINESDPDNNNDWIEVTVAIQNPQPDDILQLDDPLAIPVSLSLTIDAVNKSITLSGHDTASEFLTALFDDQLVFGNPTSSNPGSSRTIEVYITDSDATIPNGPAGTFDIPINEINDPPVISNTDPTAAFIENQGGVAISSTLNIADPDDTNMSSATISFSSGFLSNQDILSFTDQNGITGSSDTNTGVMTLTGSAPIADYELAIRSVTYDNSSQDPDETNRTLSVIVNDGQANSTASAITVSVESVNDIPTIAGSNPTPSYTIGTLDFIIDDQISISDPDDTNMSGGTVTITNFESSDLLSLGSTNGITGTFDDQTGILTLSGNATIADYNQAFSSVAYANNEDGSQSPKNIEYVVTDASSGTSSPYNVDITLIPQNIGSVTANPVNTSAQIGVITNIDVISASTVDPIANASLTILTSPSKGSASINSNLIIEYTPSLDATGTDQIEYEICNVNDICDSDFVNISILNEPPTVLPPETEVPAGGIATIELSDAINDPDNNIDPSSLKIVSQPSSGAPASFDADGNLIIDYTGLTFQGEDQLTIEVCDLSGECTQVTLQVIVGDVTSITVYNIVSPNGDGKHDFMKIQNIKFFPDNEVKVYSRTGSLLWEGKNYDNLSVIFTGIGENGEELVDGTYYYTVKFSNGTISDNTSGFLVIKR